MAELKPCRCGNKNLTTITEKVGVTLWLSMVMCMATPCDNYTIVSRYGCSKRHAEKRAIEAWNGRAGDGK